jgi:hypothetical protein
MKKETKFTKIKLGDVVYGFRTKINISEEVTDVVKNGQILMIKEGMKPSTDVFGTVLGTKAKGYNGARVREENLTQQLKDLLLEAVQRTKRLEEIKKNGNGSKRLPELFVKHHRNHAIKKHEEEYYFIDSVAYCANCQQVIAGMQKLEVNNYGKVSRMDPFIPTEPTVKLPSGKKWVHSHCAASPVEIPEEHRIAKFQLPKTAERTKTITISTVLLEGIIEALDDVNKFSLIPGLTWAIFKTSE